MEEQFALDRRSFACVVAVFEQLSKRLFSVFIGGVLRLQPEMGRIGASLIFILFKLNFQFARLMALSETGARVLL